MTLSPDEFDACFDRFTATAFRLETLPAYMVDVDPDYAAFLAGRPVSERSVRTSPWMARIAATTAAGKLWRRVHIVTPPLGEYLRYEIDAYAESQAVGEQIRLVDDTHHTALAELTEDFWLFDAETDSASAIRCRYEQDGTLIGNESVTDAATIGSYAEIAERTWAAGLPLNEFVAQLR